MRRSFKEAKKHSTDANLSKHGSTYSGKEKGLKLRLVSAEHPVLTERDTFANNLILALAMAARNSFNLTSDLGGYDSESSESLESEAGEEEEKPITETFNLMTCSAREYIQKTVAQPLLLAMATLEKERPDNSIEFIAEYLLFYKNDLEEEEKRKKDILKTSINSLSYYKQIKRSDLGL